jgi:hypothetical protein
VKLTTVTNKVWGRPTMSLIEAVKGMVTATTRR